MYEITPLLNCPHLSDLLNIDLNPSKIVLKCEVCGEEKEPWICLSCGCCLCGRFSKSHMIEHVKKTKHFLVLGYTDLSVWCYGKEDGCDGCDYYINQV